MGQVWDTMFCKCVWPMIFMPTDAIARNSETAPLTALELEEFEPEDIAPMEAVA